MARDRVGEIGEFGLIDRLRDVLPENARALPRTGVGIGDDAAVWKPPADEDLVVTTDALIENIHFRLEWTDWESLGHKMLAVNLSDIAAMGAVPRLATVVLGLTGEEAVDDIEDLYRGAGRLAAAHGTVIAGGDIVRSPHGLVISVMLLGSVVPGQALTRSGARPGDLIVVSGTLGASGAGLALLEGGDDRTSTGPLLRAAHLRPQPRLALGAIMFEAGVSAAMDLSDGLLGDLPKILVASGVGGRIEADLIPVLPAVRAVFPDRWLDLALRGGEDYELLMTIAPERFAHFQQLAGVVGGTVTVIGEITDDEPASLSVTNDGEPMDLQRGAFDHFAMSQVGHLDQQPG
ncbi:MAG TPA: thiamine-phosphate kinase [Thermomicrobiales bacterium]|nr:thiamine-phosphate kinase [Thermomicrobiales bacterium]